MKKSISKYQASLNAVNALNRSNTVLLMEPNKMEGTETVPAISQEKGIEDTIPNTKLEDHKSSSSKEKSKKPLDNTFMLDETEEIFIVNISHAHYPLELLTEHQMDLIEETLLSFIDNLEQETSICPQFETCCRINGILRIICCNKETHDWFKMIITRIRPWENAILKPLSEFDLGAKYFKILLKRRRTEKYLNQNQFLKRVQTQNKGIQVNQWKVDKIEIEENNFVMYRVAVDEASATTLLARDGILHIGLHKVQAVPVCAGCD